MTKKLFLTVLSLNIFFVINPAFAQDTLFNGKKYKLGFTTGNGIQYIGQLIGNDNHHLALDAKYYYQVTFYQVQYYLALSRKKTFGIDILAQPQYNITKYKQYDDASTYLKGYEAGLNIDLVIRKNTSNGLLSFYLLAGTGPHYASGTPHRQASGFLFSDNFAGGINLKLYKNLYADMRAGFRHISNARLRTPNAGVNDLTFTEGLLVSF